MKQRTPSSSEIVPRWGTFELTLPGPDRGNPFVDVSLAATFTNGRRRVEVDGFYDGDGIYRVRFMPDAEGRWRFETRANVAALDGRSGELMVGPPGAGNHGPVAVSGKHHFAYADGTFHSCVGTTSYVWIWQEDALVRQTLRTLRDGPFDKLRLCVFPKHYRWNTQEPPCYPFEQRGRARRKAPWRWDTTRFVPAYFQRLERNVAALRELGVEADVILFHPYDRWGFSKLDRDADERYVRYVVARLGAYRNVWWSLANEWDLLDGKTAKDFDRLGRLVARVDPYGHLRSIHNCWKLYDHGKPWITHASIQHMDAPLWQEIVGWRERWGKPVVIDENRYEGNLPTDWGSLDARELVARFWIAAVAGAYNGHSETVWHASERFWWAHGGVLRGESAARIGFLRRILTEGPGVGWEPRGRRVSPWTAVKAEGTRDETHLFYFGANQPREWAFAALPRGRFRLELIDPWAMRVRPLPGVVRAETVVELPGRPGLAVRARRA
jgi:hypothetical protein